ncbi:PsiF family protein [Dankookia sp. P2]
MPRPAAASFAGDPRKEFMSACLSGNMPAAARR